MAYLITDAHLTAECITNCLTI